MASALAALVLALGVAGLQGCSTIPATGKRAFTLLSPEEERRIGAGQHPRTLAEFGGAYADPALQALVSGIGAALVAGSEHPDETFTFSVLDSPEVNAFALPGGYVYVSRGLMALADSEADLAGVIGHEIGHVTARHGAQMHGRSVVVNLLGAVFGDLNQATGTGGGLAPRGYSREQEFEADSLGLRYLVRAGYQPDAMASFLAKLRDVAKLDAAMLGGGSDLGDFGLMSTHPRTADRVQEARSASIGVGPSGGRTGRESYLRRIDGMIYGNPPERGYVRGQRFVHPILRFEFSVAPDFVLVSASGPVSARGPNGAVMQFDFTEAEAGTSMPDYLARRWGRRLALTGLARLEVNGMPAATGVTRVSTDAEPVDLRLVAIQGGDGRTYRFLFATPVDETARQAAALQRIAFSFRRISEAEAARERPLRLRIHTARAGDSVARLARRMPGGSGGEAWFRILNGLRPGEEPVLGQLLKYVSF